MDNDIQSFKYYVYNDNMEICGKYYFHIHKEHPFDVHITDIYVFNDYRNCGCGNSILRHLENNSRNLKCKKIRTTTPRFSWKRKWFERNGYQKVGGTIFRVFLEKNIDKK